MHRGDVHIRPDGIQLPDDLALTPGKACRLDTFIFTSRCPLAITQANLVKQMPCTTGKDFSAVSDHASDHMGVIQCNKRSIRWALAMSGLSADVCDCCAGCGGHKLSDIEDDQKAWIAEAASHHGYGRVTVESGSSLLWEYVRNKDSRVHDSIRISNSQLDRRRCNAALADAKEQHQTTGILQGLEVLQELMAAEGVLEEGLLLQLSDSTGAQNQTAGMPQDIGVLQHITAAEDVSGASPFGSRQDEVSEDQTAVASA